MSRKDTFLALIQKCARTKETALDSLDLARLTGDSVPVASATLASLARDKVMQCVARRNRHDRLGRVRATTAYYAPEIVERQKPTRASKSMDASALCAAWG